MIFYVITGPEGTIGCALSKSVAVKAAKADGNEGTYVSKIILGVSPRECIRLLLAGAGGYAASQETVYEVPQS